MHLKFYIEQFPPTSTCLKHHILRAYSQYLMWHHAAFIENIQMNLDKYGHKFDEPSTPTSFSVSCNYSKCSYSNVPMLCKRRQIVSYGYRKCSGDARYEDP